MNRHQQRERFSLMKHDDFTMELRVRQDAKDPELYGMLSEAIARLDHWKHGCDQLNSYLELTADKLGVIPEQPYILKEIQRIKAHEEALTLIREYAMGVSSEAGGIDTSWLINTVDEALQGC